MAGTAIILINDKKEILIGKRLKTKGFNKYAAPGGTVEENESDDMACIRECKEETNITVNKLAPLTTTNQGTDTETRWFISEDFHGEVVNTEPEKCAGWEWFPLNNLPQPMWNGLEQVTKMLGE